MQVECVRCGRYNGEGDVCARCSELSDYDVQVGRLSVKAGACWDDDGTITLGIPTLKKFIAVHLETRLNAESALN